MIYHDLETFNTIPLKTHGTYKYTASCEILLYAYAKDDRAVDVIDITRGYKVPTPKEGETLCAHNSSFDRTALLSNGYKWANDYTWVDTSMMAAVHALPIGLDNLCKYYKLTEEHAKKAKRGKELIRFFTMPQKNGKRNTQETHPAEWVEFMEYAAYDTISMRKLYELLPKWNLTAKIYNEWILDQRVNDRGYKIDRGLCENAIKLQEDFLEQGNSLLQKLTTVQTENGEHETLVHTCNQTEKIIDFLSNYCGLSLPDMKAETVKDALSSPYTNSYAKEILTLRQQHALNSASKYISMLDYAGADDKVKGTLLFGGAQRTLRWGGRGVQPHNFPSPTLSEDQIKNATELLKIQQTKLVYNSEDVLRSLTRSAIIAEPGKKIVNCDYKSIEGRVLPWLASDHKKVNAYTEYDKHGGYDTYEKTFSDCFNIPVEEVTKANRKIGKVVELAMQFAGGVDAIVRGAKKSKLDLDEVAKKILPSMDSALKLDAKQWFDICAEKRDTSGLKEDAFISCDCLKRLWRQRNPLTVKFWKKLNVAFENAILLNRRTRIGRIVIDFKDGFVRICLPSGRYMCYPNAAVINGKCSYCGYVKHKWSRIFTHGGKIAENVTQSVARDILAHSFPVLEVMGYEILLHVHDEVNCQTPDHKSYSVSVMSNLMGQPIPWAPYLPLAFEGYESYCFKKG